ncbi:hypothetical protein ONZ45_g5232 [Pleurotus djamor]|nr:hypothetical protein ONZ45_g5232 [Pleurotus djamor]
MSTSKQPNRWIFRLARGDADVADEETEYEFAASDTLSMNDLKYKNALFRVGWRDLLKGKDLVAVEKTIWPTWKTPVMQIDTYNVYLYVALLDSGRLRLVGGVGYERGTTRPYHVLDVVLRDLNEDNEVEFLICA